MHYQYFYPAQEYHPYPDICLKRREEVRRREPYEWEDRGWVLLGPSCATGYGAAFGIDHNKLGVSWYSPQ